MVKAIELDDSLNDAKYYLALIYENNDRDQARKLYVEILEQDPTYINARNALNEINMHDHY